MSHGRSRSWTRRTAAEASSTPRGPQCRTSLRCRQRRLTPACPPAPPSPPPACSMARPGAPAAPPPRQRTIDVYMTLSTGHQAGSGVSKPASWHKSRSAKLNQQFRSRPALLPVLLPPSAALAAPAPPPQRPAPSLAGVQHAPAVPPPARSPALPSTANPAPVFARLSIYINGTTHPIISDLELKHRLAAHGAHVCSSVARKTTTHVIVSPRARVGSGAGGGLAAGKLQKEISSSQNTIKYVSVHW